MDRELSFLTETLPGEAEFSWQTQLYLLCGTLGHAFYIAWFFVCMVSRDFVSPEVSAITFDATTHMLFLFGFIMMLIVGVLFSNALSTKNGHLMLSIIAVLLCSAAPVSTCFQSSGSVHLLAWFATGFGGACLLLLSSAFLSSLSHKRVLFCVSTSIAVGIFFCMGIMYLSDYARIVAVELLLAFALIFILSQLGKERKNRPFVSAATSKERSKISWKSCAAVLGNSICLGIILYCVTFVSKVDWRFALFGMVAVLASLVLVYDVVHKELINEELQLRFFLPCAVIGFLPIPFFGEVGLLIGCSVLIIAFTWQGITNICAVSENVYLDNLQPIRSFAAWRIWNLAGALAGYLAGFFAFSFATTSAMGSMTFAVLFIVIALLIVLGTLFFQNRYPTTVSEGQREEREQGKKGRWMRKCEALSHKIGLSSREEEVLMMLGKGHEVEYIQDKLFISKSTVKNHISSIYRKADVHSRKDLIALIELIDE